MKISVCPTWSVMAEHEFGPPEVQMVLYRSTEFWGYAEIIVQSKQCANHSWKKSFLLFEPHHATRGPLVLYRSPECWEYVKITGYWGKEV